MKRFGYILIDIDKILSVAMHLCGSIPTIIVHYENGEIDEFHRESAECCADEQASFDKLAEWVRTK